MVLLQFVPLLAIFTGITTRAIVIFVVLYFSRVFLITGVYHRYFAHRTYRMGRATQAVAAFAATSCAQRGPLWWASHHRDHHRYTDTDRDPHSPQQGFWWSHMGWILSGRFGDVDLAKIDDFAKFPELRWINKRDWIAPWLLGIASFLIGGWSGLVFGFFGSTVLLWHATFSVNSFAHVFGTRRYATSDTSRNNPVIAALTLGEGWHNNHHHYPACARQGFRWYEIDVTYYVLRLGALLHLVHDLREPTPAVKQRRRLRDGYLDLGMYRYGLAKAAAIAESTEPDLAAAMEQAAEEAARVAASERIPVAQASPAA